MAEEKKTYTNAVMAKLHYFCLEMATLKATQIIVMAEEYNASNPDSALLMDIEAVKFSAKEFLSRIRGMNVESDYYEIIGYSGMPLIFVG